MLLIMIIFPLLSVQLFNLTISSPTFWSEWRQYFPWLKNRARPAHALYANRNDPIGKW